MKPCIRLWSIGILLILFRSQPVFPQGPDGQTFTRGIDVIHYLIHLEIPDIRKSYLSGYTDIQIMAARNDVFQVELDLLSYRVDSVWYNEEKVPGFAYDGRKLLIDLPDTLDRGTPFILSVFYQGTPPRDPQWGGFYFRDGTAFNMGVGMGSIPPVFGRAWFPCVDNFTDRASYEYFIQVEDRMTAVCSGVLTEVIDLPGPFCTYHWQLEQSIPTYLSSVAVSEYALLEQVIPGMEREIPAEIYVKPADTAKARRSFETLPAMVDAFEHMFGPYAWPRIGFVSVPFSGGAMEHATNISLSRSTITGDLGFESLYAHELSHSWFGNQVTCATAGDMWLNEGWASYCQSLYTEYVHGSEAYRKSVRANHYQVLQQAYLADGGYYPVYGLPPSLTYGSTVYDKGADMLHTLRGYLGDKIFFRAVKQYIRNYSFKSVTTNEFKHFLSGFSGINLDEFFNAWIYQPGFPLFTIDSLFTVKDQGGYRTRVYVEQQLKARDAYTYDNTLEVVFYDRYWNHVFRKISLQGKEGFADFSLPFQPVAAWLDPDEKVSDATTDEILTVSRTGRFEFPEENFVMEVLSLNDSMLVRPSLLWLQPDRLSPGREVVADRYWDIQWIYGQGSIFKGSLILDPYIAFGSKLLREIKRPLTPSLIRLYYRKGPGASWNPVDFEATIRDTSIQITPRDLYRGQYAVALSPTVLE